MAITGPTRGDKHRDQAYVFHLLRQILLDEASFLFIVGVKCENVFVHGYREGLTAGDRIDKADASKTFIVRAYQQSVAFGVAIVRATTSNRSSLTEGVFTVLCIDLLESCSQL
jgi:hypothetical protein